MTQNITNTPRYEDFGLAVGNPQNVWRFKYV